jgi:lysophospholipase L1-like esterase
MRLSVVVLLGLLGCAGDAMPEVSKTVPDEKVKGDLQELSRRRVFFGHQSVGENLVRGIEELAAAAGQPLAVTRGGGVDVPAGTLRHELVGANRDPLAKLRGFEAALGEHSSADVALLKFCYVDVEADSDADALFAEYEKTLARLEAKHPHTTFVRATVPLMTFQRGPRAMAKRLLGRETGEGENARRDKFNALVREAAARSKAPLFDVARAESTRPDGTVEQVVWRGKSVPGLVPAYTHDGGHLNALGRERTARELAAVLAAAPLRGLSTQRVP